MENFFYFIVSRLKILISSIENGKLKNINGKIICIIFFLFLIPISSLAFTCEVDEMPLQAIWNKYIPVIKDDGKVYFFFFENNDGSVFLRQMNPIDLTTEVDTCPYDLNSWNLEVNDFLAYGSYLFNNYAKMDISIDPLKISLIKGTLPSIYSEGMLHISFNPLDVKSIDFNSNVGFEGIFPPRLGQVVKEFDLSFYSFGGDGKVDIWKYYESGVVGWEKLYDISSELEGEFPNDSSIIDVARINSQIVLLIKNPTGKLYGIKIESNSSNNDFTIVPSSKKYIGIDYLENSSHGIRCANDKCSVAVQISNKIKINNNIFGVPLVFEKELGENVNNSKVFIIDNGVVVQNHDTYYYTTSQPGDETAIKNSFFSSGDLENYIFQNELYEGITATGPPDASTESTLGSYCNNTPDSNADLSYWNLRKGIESELDIKENQILTYMGETSSCFSNKFFKFETTGGFGCLPDKDCIVFNPEEDYCINTPTFYNPSAQYCGKSRGYMKGKMPLKFIYDYNAGIAPQNIFTFEKNNKLNFSAMFDFGYRRIFGIYAKEQDENFKGFYGMNLGEIINIKESDIGLVLGTPPNSDDWTENGIQMDDDPTISINSDDMIAGQVLGSTGGVVDYVSNPISRGSFILDGTFEPGHHTLHIILLAKDMDVKLLKTAWADAFYGFGPDGFRAFGEYYGQTEEIEPSAFENLGNTQPDNYNIFYYVLVYDFYVPEITNISSGGITIGGNNPVIKGSGAVAGADLSFYSGYSKQDSFDETPPNFSSLIAHMPRLNGLPMNMPIFTWNTGSNLPFVHVQPTSLTHKMRVGSNGEFSFKPVASFPYLEGDNLDEMLSGTGLDHLSDDEKDAYQISVQYLDDQGNLIGAPPKQFKMKSGSASVLFYHTLNKDGVYETDSKRPVIAGSYLPNTLISARLPNKIVQTLTDDKGDFKLYIDLHEFNEIELRIFLGTKKLGTLPIKNTQKDFPEIVTPISGEQYYSRYIPFECNAKPGSTVYFRFWKEFKQATTVSLEEIVPYVQDPYAFSITVDQTGKCAGISPRLLYLNEELLQGLDNPGNSVYYLSASYQSDSTIYDRVSFRMRQPTDFSGVPSMLYPDTYFTPNSLQGVGDDIKLLSGSRLKFEFSRFRNTGSVLDFSTLNLFSSGDVTISPGVSLLMAPSSMIEIKSDGVFAILSKGTTVIHKKTGIENIVYNPGIYHFNGEYLSVGDIIKSPKTGTLVDFMTEDEIKLKTFNEILFMSIFENKQLNEKTHVITSQDAKYSFGESDLIFAASCDGVIIDFFKKFEEGEGKEYYENGHDLLSSSLSREDCLLYSQLSIDKDKSPGFIYPRNSYRIKSGEKLHVLGYAWPGSNIRISVNRQLLGTTNTNQDGFFEFISPVVIPEVLDGEGDRPIYIDIEDTDQGYTTKNIIVAYLVPKEDDNIDEFTVENLRPSYYQVSNAESKFHEYINMINTSIFNKKK